VKLRLRLRFQMAPRMLNRLRQESLTPGAKATVAN
jgi:hypothetical protein